MWICTIVNTKITYSLPVSVCVCGCVCLCVCLSVSLPGIEELCFNRDELNGQISQEEEEKARLQHDIRMLTEKLSRVNESLAQRLAARSNLDHTIAETEAAYMKV